MSDQTALYELLMAQLEQEWATPPSPSSLLQMAQSGNRRLIARLLKTPELNKHFFFELEGCKLFDQGKFADFVQQQQYFKDSFTRFANRIGLGSNGQFLSQQQDVVLAWPYKDCLLRGGQSREEAQMEEPFLNFHLAPEAVDRLLRPKVLHNYQRFAKGKPQPSSKFSKTDNWVLKGNNLVALHSLAEVFRGQVKLIYIDPPFNTGKDAFSYNDRFNHATWLTFLRNRLQVALELLHPEGTLFLHLDHNEVHYAKVLLDELMGRERLLNEIIWCYTGPGSPKMRQFNRKHDTILWYAKSDRWTFNADAIRMPSQVHAGGFKGEMDGKTSKAYTEKGKVPEDWWQMAVAARFRVDGQRRTGYNTEKPVKLLERIILAASDQGDLILDFFGGSGTTAWVAANLGRQFITIEQMEAGCSVLRGRLQKGGHAFHYAELLPHPGNYLQRIFAAQTPEQLLQLLQEIVNSPWRYYAADVTKIEAEWEAIAQQDVGTLRKLLVSLTDLNRLYVDFDDRHDQELSVSKKDRLLSEAFYAL